MIKKLSSLIVTIFGIGYLPYAPGTFGSLASLIIGGALRLTCPEFHLWIAIGVVLALSFIFIPLYLKNHPGRKDPQEIVIDEVVGQLVALLSCENFFEMGLAFAFFRFFDIYKPWPLSWAEGLEGGPFKNSAGIILDDILAGLIALAGIWSLKGFYLR